MNTQTLQRFGLALALALGPLLGGCDQERAQSAPVGDTASNPATNQPQGDAPPAAGNPAPASPATEDQQLADAQGKIISSPGAAANTNANPQLNQVVKLAQAGVGEAIMMAYVTNSPITFNISSDDVIYLNDIGVPETVVNAMLQHDQAIAATSAQALPQPAYTNPPVDSAAPPPDQVATLDNAAQPDIEVTPPLTPAPDAIDDSTQAPNGSYSYFYDSLAPYGSWINIGGYGPCWQPTVGAFDTGWQPYCDRGHWIYTDCGWCWVSDYTWGWAAFHYGRWFHHNHFGWCWAPDIVWGPAWVGWRWNAGFCGWAPLPPSACYRPGFGFTFNGQSVGFNFTFGLSPQRFVFVPLNHFHDRAPGRFRVQHREVTGFFNTTTVKNQIIRGNNNTLINPGVPVDRVAAAAHTDIQPVHIRAESDGSQFEQWARDGRTLTVYRPALPAAKPAGTAKFVGEGVRPEANFDLRSHVERTSASSFMTPPTVTASEHRPIISNPGEPVPRAENPRATPLVNNSTPRAPIVNNNQATDPRFSQQPNNSFVTQPPAVRRNPTWSQRPANPQQEDGGRILLSPGQSQGNEPRPATPAPRWQTGESRQQPIVPTPREEAPRYYPPPQGQPGANSREFNQPARSEPQAPRNNFESRPSAPAQSEPSHQENSGNFNNNNNNGNSGGRGH